MISTGREPDKENAVTAVWNNTQGGTNILPYILLLLFIPASSTESSNISSKPNTRCQFEQVQKRRIEHLQLEHHQLSSLCHPWYALWELTY